MKVRIEEVIIVENEIGGQIDPRRTHLDIFDKSGKQIGFNDGLYQYPVAFWMDFAQWCRDEGIIKVEYAHLSDYIQRP